MVSNRAKYNVWIAAADRADRFFAPSRSFLMGVAQQRLDIYLPSFAWIELACALARRQQNAETGRQLTNVILGSPQIIRVAMDEPYLAYALLSGTQALLRRADALYAATAQITGAQPVSWDAELLQRAGAITPTDWLAANP